MTAERPVVVLDASVGVKWIKPEAGRTAALALLDDHREGQLHIVVASLFVHDLVAVGVRHGGPDLGERVWSALRLANLTVIGLDDVVAAAALEQCKVLGCSFYDALAPALAEQLDAPLFSADARAHARFSRVTLVG